MAITLVASGQANHASSAVTSAFNSTGASLIVLSVASNGGSGAATISDSRGNTYTALTHRELSFIRHQLFYCVNPLTSAGHTVTATGTNVALQAWAFAGVGSYQASGGLSGATGTASPLAMGSLTPSANGSLLFTGIGGYSGGVTDSAPTLFTTAQQQSFTPGTSYQNSTAYYIQPTAAAINPAWTWTGSKTAGASFAIFTAALPAAGARTTQQVVELLSVLLASDVRVTQDVTEVLSAQTPVPSRVTQHIAEVLSRETVAGVMTQYVAEALSANIAPKDYTWQIKELPDVTRWMTGLLVFPEGEPDPPPTGGVGAQVFIPMHVTTRVVFPAGVAQWGADCLCDE